MRQAEAIVKALELAGYEIKRRARIELRLPSRDPIEPMTLANIREESGPRGLAAGRTGYDDGGLADFAKLVELFDQHSVSFVSVTQSFNTTSSIDYAINGCYLPVGPR